MRLPGSSHSITLDTEGEGLLVADSTDPPAAWWDDEALRLFLPAFARDGDSELRDALLAAWAEMVGMLWAASSRLLDAQQSPRNASGAFLAEHGSEQHRPQAPGESEAGYRLRLLTTTDIISPNAIVGTVVGVCAPRGIPVYFQEPQANGWYWASDATTWTPFYSGAGRWWGLDPSAPAFVRGGGYWMGPNALLPTLWIFLGQRVSFEEESTLFCSGPSLAPSGGGYFIGGTSSWDCFLATAAPVDEAVANELDVLVAAGVNWTIFYDPLA